MGATVDSYSTGDIFPVSGGAVTRWMAMYPRITLGSGGPLGHVCSGTGVSPLTTLWECVCAACGASKSIQSASQGPPLACTYMWRMQCPCRCERVQVGVGVIGVRVCVCVCVVCCEIHLAVAVIPTGNSITSILFPTMISHDILDLLQDSSACSYSSSSTLGVPGEIKRPTWSDR